MYQNRIDGGDNGARTRDLLTASQALSQLSYTPEHCYYSNALRDKCQDFFSFFRAAIELKALFIYNVRKSAEVLV